jgi:hypothetical protein
MPVMVTFESDWRRARTVLDGILNEVAAPHAAAADAQIRKATRKFFIHYAHTTPVVYTELRQSGVQLTMRYLCPARLRRGTAAALSEAVLDAFRNEPRVQLAYPTSRVIRNNEEGKGPLREGTSAAGGPASVAPGDVEA